MAKSFVRISLAAKFRVLFAAAVAVILAAALGVPWYFTERLMDEAAEQSGAQIAELGLQEWLEQHPQKPRPGSDMARYFTAKGGGRRGPRFIPAPAEGPREGLDRQTRRTINAFRKDPLRKMTVAAEEDEQGRRLYRSFLAVRSGGACANCHDGKAAPAFQPEQLAGVVDVTLPPVSGSLIWWTRGIFLLGGLLAALLAFAVFYVITQQIILSPVRKLSSVAEKVAEGDLASRCDVQTGDEFERLGRRFNEMLDAIALQQDKLRQANRALDLRLGEMAQANIGLYEANRVKNEFLANVSHELRTPLNSIMGFAELLAETDDEKRRRHANHILSSAKMLLGIINDLLDLARIEAGRVDLRIEKVGLADLVETLAQLVRPMADKKRLALEVRVEPDIPLLRTDPGKLQQVLYNLLSNAIKFTPPEGHVSITARRAPASQSPLEADSIAVSVADTGPGIAQADQQRIFEKFHRLDNSITREHSGTGLGLAISKELTALLEGKITLESEPAHGATFTVFLPVRPDEPPPASQHQPGAAGV